MLFHFTYTDALDTYKGILAYQQGSSTTLPKIIQKKAEELNLSSISIIPLAMEGIAHTFAERIKDLEQDYFSTYVHLA